MIEINYCAIRDAALDQCLGLWAHAYAARAVDHAIADYGLRIEGERGRSFVSLDYGSCRHWTGIRRC